VKFIQETVMKVQRGEWRCSSTFSLTVAVDGGRWSVPPPDHFTTENDLVPIV
jgi:hypothetical protein